MLMVAEDSGKALLSEYLSCVFAWDVGILQEFKRRVPEIINLAYVEFFACSLHSYGFLKSF